MNNNEEILEEVNTNEQTETFDTPASYVEKQTRAIADEVTPVSVQPIIKEESIKTVQSVETISPAKPLTNQVPIPATVPEAAVVQPQTPASPAQAAQADMVETQTLQPIEPAEPLIPATAPLPIVEQTPVKEKPKKSNKRKKIILLLILLIITLFALGVYIYGVDETLKLMNF